MSDFAIKVENLSKKYIIGHGQSGSLRETLSNAWQGAIGRQRTDEEEFWALRDINFEIKQGEAVGIIGRNGAGKSTLLKLLSKITYPTTGKITMNGRVSSLLEVGTGFHPELTGRENIYLNGTILGMSRKEVKSKFDEIVAFSGVEKFLDTPVKRYSSGMYVRLAFAVAAHLEPEILIIDEVLAVGDAEFQKKCLGKMDEVAKGGRTVLFVSHNMAAINGLCKQGILLQNGVISTIGNIDNVISRYFTNKSDGVTYIAPLSAMLNPEAYIEKIELLNQEGFVCNEFTCIDKIVIRIFTKIIPDNHPFRLFIIIRNSLGAPVFSADTKITQPYHSLQIEDNFLTRGKYSVYTFIHVLRTRIVDEVDNICPFNITDTTSDFAIHGTYDYGNVFGRYTWIE